MTRQKEPTTLDDECVEDNAEQQEEDNSNDIQLMDVDDNDSLVLICCKCSPLNRNRYKLIPSKFKLNLYRCKSFSLVSFLTIL